MPAFYTINIRRIYMKQIICFPIYIWRGYCGQKSFQSVSTGELGFVFMILQESPNLFAFKTWHQIWESQPGSEPA